MAGLGAITAAKGLTEAAVVEDTIKGVPSMEVLTQKNVIIYSTVVTRVIKMNT